MSTFCGEISEIPGIGVDNFSNTSLECYFVSHCHADHVKNISSLQGSDRPPIFATELSALILRRQYPELNIKPLEIGIPTPMKVFNDDKELSFVVTLLNGGHCMGSCMFLFQIEGLDILYTGDFRISLKNAQNVKNFKEIKKYGKLILYLDTTFMKKEYEHFPQQGESCSKIIEVVQLHLEESMRNKVNLEVPARYGYERLLIELNMKLNEPIFVADSEIREQYLMISEMSKCISINRTECRIILTRAFQRAREEQDKRCLHIHLSAMYWTHWRKPQPIVQEVAGGRKRICYATHSSLSEIRDFLHYLKPATVYATVLPAKLEERIQMTNAIEQIIDSYRTIDDAVPKKRFAFKKLRKN